MRSRVKRREGRGGRREEWNSEEHGPRIGFLFRYRVL